LCISYLFYHTYGKNGGILNIFQGIVHNGLDRMHTILSFLEDDITVFLEDLIGDF